ncbi:hypothetical protein PAMP_009618 [Pampus punctatissimus]
MDIMMSVWFMQQEVLIYVAVIMWLQINMKNTSKSLLEEKLKRQRYITLFGFTGVGPIIFFNLGTKGVYRRSAWLQLVM